MFYFSKVAIQGKCIQSVYKSYAFVSCYEPYAFI